PRAPRRAARRAPGSRAAAGPRRGFAPSPESTTMRHGLRLAAGRAAAAARLRVRPSLPALGRDAGHVDDRARRRSHDGGPVRRDRAALLPEALLGAAPRPVRAAAPR